MDSSTVIKILVDCFRLDKPVPKRVPVITVNNDNSRSIVVNGRFYSPLMDTIADDLARRGVDSFGVARIASRIRGDRSHALVHAPDGGFARALLQKHCLRLLRRRGGSAYAPMEEAVWRQVIRDSGAQRIVAIQPSRELCVASRALGVWVGDLQHGVIAGGHPWYDEASRGHEPAEWLPNAFLAWDEGSAAVTRDWVGRYGVKTQVIGHPWLARFRAMAPDDTVVHEQIAKFAEWLPRRDREANILVSLSWGEADLTNGFLHEELIALIQSTADRFNWMIRLHPNQMRGFASNEAGSFASFQARVLPPRVEWRHSSEAPLPVVLGASDLHISWTSSVTIEASFVGVPSALLNPKLNFGQVYERYFADQRRAGTAQVIAADRVPILDWIEGNLGRRAIPAPTVAAERSYHELIGFLSGART